MVRETIFQNWIFKEYILPFLLVFVLLFAVLEKTKLLGEGKGQLNAILSFVVSLMVVGFIFPKEVISNLILFLSIALVVAFVFLLLYGFVSGNKDGFELSGGLKIALGVIVGIAVIIAVIWATGINTNFFDLFFRQAWSEALWTNIAFIAIFVFVVSWVLKSAK
jgi:hypothetical protein